MPDSTPRSVSAEGRLLQYADRVRDRLPLSADEAQEAAEAIRAHAKRSRAARAGRARWAGVPDQERRDHMAAARRAAAEA